MHSESFREFVAQPISEQHDNAQAETGNWLIWIHVLTFLFGLGLLVYVIYAIGFHVIIESVERVGWGFLFIMGLNMARHAMRAWSLFLAIPPEFRTFNFRSVLAARFGGEAISFLTFTGPFLGDATKAVLLKKHLPLVHGAAAVIVDNILYYVSVILIVLGGIGILQYFHGTDTDKMGNVFASIFICAILSVTLLLLAIKFRVTPLSWVINKFAEFHLAPRFIVRKINSIREVESTVVRFYHSRRKDFFLIFGISLSVHAVSVSEVYLALKLLGFETIWSNAFVIEGLTKVINVVFGFVPGTVGVYEGGNGIILRWLGYAVVVGVALALVRRGAILFSTFVGLVVLLWRAIERGTQQLAKSGL